MAFLLVALLLPFCSNFFSSSSPPFFLQGIFLPISALKSFTLWFIPFLLFRWNLPFFVSNTSAFWEILYRLFELLFRQLFCWCDFHPANRDMGTYTPILVFCHYPTFFWPFWCQLCDSGFITLLQIKSLFPCFTDKNSIQTLYSIFLPFRALKSFTLWFYTFFAFSLKFTLFRVYWIYVLNDMQALLSLHITFVPLTLPFLPKLCYTLVCIVLAMLIIFFNVATG